MNGDLMTGVSSAEDHKFSFFNVALLKDTGFYAEVSEEHYDDFSWGKGRGCNFLTGSCDVISAFPEFVDTGS
jgi:proprotein convertase subtilisin/kexin type 5